MDTSVPDRSGRYGPAFGRGSRAECGRAEGGKNGQEHDEKRGRLAKCQFLASYDNTAEVRTSVVDKASEKAVGVLRPYFYTQSDAQDHSRSLDEAA